LTSPQPIADPVAWPIVEAMLASLADQVRCLASPPAVVSARPGDRIELLLAQGRDECCEGLGWVRVSSIYPSVQFPAADADASNCGVRAWAVVLEIGIARCAPVPGASAIPSAAEWSTVTAAVMDDAAAIRRTVQVFKTLPDFEDSLWLVGAWVPMTTEGGCVGGSMEVTVQAIACDTEVCQ
jgi:hypothetical protein